MIYKIVEQFCIHDCWFDSLVKINLKKEENRMKNQVELAYEFIKIRILDGRFKPSQKLVENELASTIGVSRNTIRNALLLLEKEKLVEIEKNKGAKIRFFSLEEVKNYLEIREVLEGLIARSACQNMTDEELVSLEKNLKKMKTHLDKQDLDEYSNLNREFHDKIYNACENQQAVEFVKTIKIQLNRYHIRTILIPERKSNTYNEHKRIFNAFKDRNEDEAEEALRSHITNIRTTIEQFYQLLV